MALKGIPWLAVSLALTSVDVTVLSFGWNAISLCPPYFIAINTPDLGGTILDEIPALAFRCNSGAPLSPHCKNRPPRFAIRPAHTGYRGHQCGDKRKQPCGRAGLKDRP